MSVKIAREILSQGAEANRSGEYGQNMFESIWRASKIPVVDDHPSYHQPQMFPRKERVLIRQPRIELRFRTMHGDYLFVDFTRPLSVLFEVKSQLGGGTTDEKIFSSIETLGESPYAICCLVLYGKGFRGWVRKEAQRRAMELSSGNKLIRVISDAGDVLYRQLVHLIQNGEFP